MACPWFWTIFSVLPHSFMYTRRAIDTTIPFVRPSVTRWCCVKTAKPIVEILSSPDSAVNVVFSHLISLRNSNAVTHSRGHKYTKRSGA